MSGEGRGGKDRVSVLPPNIVAELEQHVAKVTALYHRDLEKGPDERYLSHALARKQPGKSAGSMFFGKKRSADAYSSVERR